MTGSEPRPADPRVRERTTQRTARYVVVGAEPAQATHIWIALHGYGMLAPRFVRPFADAIPEGTCVIAPEGLSRFYIEMPRADGGHLQRIGATWLTRESRDTEIADAHRWLNAVHDEVVAESTTARGHAPRVAVLGFSQGVATAMRWIGDGVARPALFVAWAGGFANDVHRDGFLRNMKHAELVLVTGDNDEFATDAYREAAITAVRELAIPHRVLSFAGTHQLNNELLHTLLHNFARAS